MNFDVTEDQEELRSAVHDVLQRECPLSVARERAERGREPEQPWRSARELGWPAIAVSEADGGLGLGFAELALVLEEHGRCLAAGPFLPTVSQLIPALAVAGTAAQREAFLAPAAAGELRGGLAVASRDGAFAPAGGAVTAVRRAGGWSLSGAAHYVIEGEAADELVVASRVEEADGVGLFLVPREAAKMERLVGLDPTRPLSTATFDAVDVGPERVLGTPGQSLAAFECVEAQATVALAVETLGACQALFESSVAYASQREQFGSPIGSFQAIAHKFADMLLALEKARATVLFAAMTIDEDDSRRALAVSMAKAQVGSAQRLVAKEGIQIHGGLGYTWEQDVHLFVKRIKAGDALFGTTAVHRARVADLLGV